MSVETGQEEPITKSRKRRELKPGANTARPNDACPLDTTIHRPTKCAKCGVEVDKNIIAKAVHRNEDGSVYAREWQCKTCGKRWQVIEGEKQKRGNKPGSNGRKSVPGHRRVEDKKGQRIDLLTTTLETIVQAPTSTNLGHGEQVLAEVRQNPL